MGNLIKNSDIQLAKKIIEKYSETQDIDLSIFDIDLLAEELADLSYSIGGEPSEEILEKMVSEFIRVTLKHKK